MKRTIFVLAAGAFIALAGTAAAHAMLSRAEPAVGASVRGPISVLRLRFSESVEPSLCRVTLQAAAGAQIAARDLSTEARGRILVAHVTPLPAGVYRVRWRAVSVDTHVTEGDYTITVTP